MKASQFFYKTSKNTNKAAATLSHELLEKAGYIVKTSKGVYTYTPIFWRVVLKMTEIIREELNAAGGQELLLPFLHPAELWQQTGRWQAFLSEQLLYTLKDRDDKEMCLAPTHEEVVTALAAQWISGRKQLPLHLYQMATKFRDEIRPRFGLMRAREFLMEDSYTFSDSPEQMDEQYEVLRAAYQKIFDRLELKYVIVSADGGKIGKGKSEEFHVLCPIGEDAICVSGAYGANVEAAIGIPPEVSYNSDLLPMEKVDTPNVKTIEELETFFSLPQHQILKTLVVKLSLGSETKLVAIGTRGDRQINMTKVGSYFKADECDFASEEEILQAMGVEKGFLGPLNCPIEFFADEITRPMTNFVCAGNCKDIHFRHVNWERDLPRPTYADFLLVEAGDLCPQNNLLPYELHRGVEVAHIFNLGTKYTECFSVEFQDEHEQKQTCWMGTYGIGIGRTLAACVEQGADSRGIVWPKAVAPFQIAIMYNGGDADSASQALAIYQDLQHAGYEPLLDDRNERLGFKLKDSDLIGIPYKFILGSMFRSSGMFEIESRQGDKYTVNPEEFPEWCARHLVVTRPIPSQKWGI